MAMAAESYILAALKIIPPKKALPILKISACLRSSKKLRPSVPKLPNVKSEIMEKISIPIT